jgi:hypothetical protein
MKKIITICLLMATAYAVKAQEMSFDETVKYINEKITYCVKHTSNGEPYNGYSFVMSATKDGTINMMPKGDNKSKTVTFNLFNLSKVPDNHDGLKSNGIRIVNHSSVGGSSIAVYLTELNFVYILSFPLQKEA